MNSPIDFQTRKLARLAKLGLVLVDFEEKFSRSSGPGGQRVNKVSTAVCLRHVPSNIAVNVQDTRSQAMNRQLAWERLLDAIESRRVREAAELRAAAQKLRRQKAKRPWGVKQRILETKHRRSETKRLRSSGEL